MQCCGFGSGSIGSVCFLGLPDPDPLVRGTDPAPDPSIVKPIVGKTLIPTVLLLLHDFLSLKNYVNVDSKVISKKIIFSCHLEGHWRK
jgi:hypothetical protein